MQGGVRPWCAQGSRVTTAVPPRARPAAAPSARTSAWGPPAGAVKPSPTTDPVASSTTQPTGGLGLVPPSALAASSMARRIASASRAGTFVLAIGRL